MNYETKEQILKAVNEGRLSYKSATKLLLQLKLVKQLKEQAAVA